ncbi:VOC family protein [Amycolatopsis sp. PS_44_ISF1]|uniref:VOC family protein n=1 Tax=Amycolatopsis sp. PS_44_ISF1 TaxID=2974917 RepID=UPI0028DEA0F5|nr:VOC family protein [Amycolatopsis sp. PS_44_ISF1]MDT8915218.1 VOC family protein [Amycolatopsis sp. PS_44_ISF1]
MTTTVGPVHHLRLTVTDVARAQAFYTEVLGLSVAVAEPPAQDDPDYWLMLSNLQGGVVLTNGSFQLGLRPCDEPRRHAGDRFDPRRVGLDHVSFQVGGHEELGRIRELCARRGYEHGEITELKPIGIAVLSVTDPDGIQLELTARRGEG